MSDEAEKLRTAIQAAYAEIDRMGEGDWESPGYYNAIDHLKEFLIEATGIAPNEGEKL